MLREYDREGKRDPGTEEFGGKYTEMIGALISYL